MPNYGGESSGPSDMGGGNYSGGGGSYSGGGDNRSPGQKAYDRSTGTSGYNPNKSGSKGTAKKKKADADLAQKVKDELAAKDKKKAEEKTAADKKKEDERKKRSLLTGYTDPNIQRRRLLRRPQRSLLQTADGATLGDDSSNLFS